MKSKTVRLWSIVCFSLCCFLLAGCGPASDPAADLPEPAFAEGEPHQYNRGVFRDWFKTMSSAAGPCTVSVRDIIYDEEQAVQWWYAIQSDLAAIYKTLNREEDAYTPFIIYVVDKTANGALAWNNYLYCTPGNILSGDYREGLVSAVLGMDETWKLTGLASLCFEEPQDDFFSRFSNAFSGEEDDADRLAAYLESGRNIPFLGLYTPYFCEDFAGELGLSMARLASRLLCEHVLREHGAALLLEDPCLDCRRELLDELGVEHTYTDLYGDFDRGYTYSSSEDYPLIVTTERGDVFHIVPLPGDMETPADVCRLLYEAAEGPQVILDAVRAEAPEYADIFAENYSKPFTCTLDPDRYGSAAWSATQKIALGDSSSIVHEIMHFFVPIGQHIAEQWKYEACADYLTYKYYPSCQIKSNYYDVFSPANLDIKTTPHVYLAHTDFPQNMDEVDIMLIAKASVAADHIVLSAAELDERESIAESYQNIGIGELDPSGGNALTYREAAAFADYLVQNYSLSTFLGYCLDPDTTFEEVYEIDFDTVKAAWLEELLAWGRLD